jgi:hypothetical protein
MMTGCKPAAKMLQRATLQSGWRIQDAISVSFFAFTYDAGGGHAGCGCFLRLGCIISA